MYIHVYIHGYIHVYIYIYLYIPAHTLSSDAIYKHMVNLLHMSASLAIITLYLDIVESFMYGVLFYSTEYG